MQSTLIDRTISQPNNGWKNQETLTQEDWDIHLPWFEELYLKEGRILTDVMMIMKERFGFVAR